jgi:hypothetical protein
MKHQDNYFSNQMLDTDAENTTPPGNAIAPGAW